MTHQPADFVFDHALELADAERVDLEEAVAELVALAAGDRSTLEQARNLLAQVLAGERAGDAQAARAHRLLDDAVTRASGPRPA